MSRRCLVLLGGSFDPVHNAHVALGSYFARLLVPDELRIIPAGNPWQKDPLNASAADRVAMLRLAFDRQPVPVVVDEQEIRRRDGSYTIDTLRAVRAEAGPDASIAFVMGADQLLHLNTWHEWRTLFDLAHICAASRPGFSMDSLPADVAREFTRRTAPSSQLRETPHGLTFLALNLAVDVSATEIRSLLAQGERPQRLLPASVLDYIEQHNLYKS
ncbi:nicotinate-nucleotide adenylyltransferase [Noviherbaspirillum suwonense]|uniref:Probable nicotinate-nucleotide adenylyltransferase n=1 Tax=Noviherbaspirillum suwonense TaxID=1224511 RepID=A0ABY1Q5G7_9BURK|nr:nicotinate-nucleotide adenylyltransferase [Noviherbaspirillum suwonense]